MRRVLAVLAPSLVLLALLVCAAPARILTIPATTRVGGPRSESGDGLLVRYKDVPYGAGCSILFCKTATDSVTLPASMTTMANVNYLLNTGTLFGPFNFGGDYFETRWDSWINIKAAGDYVFSIQVDDGAQVTISDSLIVQLDGGNWFQNATSDTIRFEYPGLYRFRAYFFDCPVCCRGFRLGAMGPAGSGMMTWTPGFNFNADLGPCCSYGGNGPGLSVVPGALFFRTMPTSDVAPAAGGAAGALFDGWTSPNPAHGTVLFTVELGRDQRVWVDVFDATGRRVAALADGERRNAGTASWPWTPMGGRAASGTYFWRARGEDGSSVSGRVVVVR